MKNYSLILSVFIVFLVIGSIRFIDDNDYATNSVSVLTNIEVKNPTKDDYQVKMIVMEDGGARAGSSIKRSSILSSQVEDIEPGEYYVRIYTYGKDGVRRIKHRPIIFE